MSIRRKLWVPQKKRPRRGLLLPVLALALAAFSVLEAGAAGCLSGIIWVHSRDCGFRENGFRWDHQTVVQEP